MEDPYHRQHLAATQLARIVRVLARQSVFVTVRFGGSHPSTGHSIAT